MAPPRQTEIAKHAQYLPFPLGFGEAVNFGQVGKARMLFFSRNRVDDMEIDQTFIQPFSFTSECLVGGRDRIDFAAQQSDISLRCRKTGDFLNSLEPEEPNHDPADVIHRVADGLRAQAHARGLPELLDGANAGLAARQK